MIFIYSLELQNGKYYVGKTTNPDYELEDHFMCFSPEWTKKYKPIRIINFYPDCTDKDLDKYTILYMEKYGIDNVRGGSFSSLELSEEDRCLFRTMSKKCENIDIRIAEETYCCCLYCGELFHDSSLCDKHENKCVYQFEDTFRRKKRRSNKN